MIQLSILKITDYGPWTLTLGSDREHELQMLQASMYKELQRMFSEKNCLVFLNKADEFFVVSNGVGLDDHVEIQKELEKLFDVHLTISIGCASTPFGANLSAHQGRKQGMSLDERYNIFGTVGDTSGSKVTMMHLDVDNLSSQRNMNSPYEISLIIFKLYSKMSEFFLGTDSLTFFMGGDNFMVVASDEGKGYVQDFIDIVKEDDRISLNCGIGNAPTCREAVKLATKSLDTIREIRDAGREKPEVYELSC